MQWRRFGRAGVVLATFCVGVSGMVVVTDGVAFPGSAQAVALAPVAATTACSVVGDYSAPEQGSAGLPPDIELCSTGPLTITTPGLVLDGWDVSGGIVVDAPDVVVRRSRITGDGSAPFGVMTTAAGSVRIEDTTLTGRFTEAALGGARWTAERVEIVGVAGDGAHAGPGTRLRGSVLHDFAPGPATTGLTVLATGGDVVVEDNEIRMAGSHAAAVRVAAGATGAAVVLRTNVLGGGEYTVHQAGGPADLEIVDNRFVRDATAAPLRVSVAAVCTGNTYVDGAPVSDC